MIPRGVQNADAIVEACKKIRLDLGEKAKPEWKAILENTIATIEDMKGKFFIKTNFAIPVTNALLKNATELQTLIASGDASGFAGAFDRLQESLQNLINRGKMEGVSIT